MQKIFIMLFGLLSLSTSTIVTDTGCTCALTKSTTTTPGAATSIAVGCSFKTDWNGQSTEWCLTDQTAGPCGTNQTAFGWVDSCAQAVFTRADIQPATKIEWDQTPYTFYTGQTINITWASQNILQDEWVRIQYPGAGGTRTLTTGSGANITTGQYAVRLTDSNNNLATNVPVTINLPSTSSISTSTNQNITVLLSKLINVGLMNNNATVASGQTLLCDNGNLTISWRGLGQAQFGLVSVSVRSGFGTLVGSSLSNIPASGNMTIDYVLPRSFNPNGGSTYTAQISVQEPGANAYTGTSIGFRLSSAPSTSPTPTSSTTSTRTASSTPSTTSTISVSPSNTPTPSTTSSLSPSPTPSNTPTPSVTPSQTPSPSTTETARPSIDYAGIARAAAEGVDTKTPVIAAVVGTLAFVVLGLGGLSYYRRLQMTKRRMAKLKMSAKFAREAGAMYNLDRHEPEDQDHVQAPSVVMYTLNVGPGANSLTSKAKKKDFAPQRTEGLKK